MHYSTRRGDDRHEKNSTGIYRDIANATKLRLPTFDMCYVAMIDRDDYHNHRAFTSSNETKVLLEPTMKK